MAKKKTKIKETAKAITKTTANSANLNGAKSVKSAKIAGVASAKSIKDLDTLKSTADVIVSDKIIDQVIGQEEAVDVMKKASSQRRHVLLIGEPGTGKSMLGLALAELLPKEKLVDLISFPNPNDENQPIIKTLPAGQGRELLARSRLEAVGMMKNQNMVSLALFVLFLIGSIYMWNQWEKKLIPDVIFAAIIISSLFVVIGVGIFFAISSNVRGRSNGKAQMPRILVDNYGKKEVPFLDATGAHAGALLGDVLHDPFQSGGLGTPAHERVVAGMIHKAHMGVLFIDEIATLQPGTQQELLTSLQEGKYSITGQSERSAGAMVRTEPVPCKFVMIAAGNFETIKDMHPALRSRIRGYGYEVYMKETMPDNPENRWKIVQFVAQEVKRDGKIPHFSKEAALQMIEEAKKAANRKGHLSLRLRELGGRVRAAGDMALNEGSALVEKRHILESKRFARPLEQQIADQYIERKKEYEVIVTEGRRVGRVNGLAVIGSGSSYSGIILPIESEITFGGKESQIIATGKLGEIAKEAIINVTAIIKRYFGEDIKGTRDIYVQFLQTHDGVEGDSASIAVATAVISALKNIPIKQDYVMTGSLSVRGEVLPIGGVTAKVEAAIDAGMKNVIVPRTNLADLVIEKEKLAKIKVIPVDTILEVLKEALDWKGKEDILKAISKQK